MNLRRPEFSSNNRDLIYRHGVDSTYEFNRDDVQEQAGESYTCERRRADRGHPKLHLTRCRVTTASKATEIQHTRTRYAGVS
jgi:hypothetical protein